MTAQICPVLAELVAASPHVVPETSLVNITKGPLTKFILTASSEDVQAIEKLWLSLLNTFSSTNLVPSHRSTICNAISSFLDTCARSSTRAIHECGLTHEKWLSVFNIFLDIYEESKPKSMRQVMKSLIIVLKGHPDRNTVNAILGDVIPSLTSTIILGEPQSRLKSSMVSLEWLLRRDVLKATKLLSYAREWLIERSNYSRWTRLWSFHCQKINIPLSQFNGEITSTEGTRFHTAQLLTTAVITHGITLQILPSAGSLITLLCHKLRVQSPGLTPYPHTWHGSPFWLDPALKTALWNLDEVDNLSYHIFFPLVREEPAGFEQIIYSLPFSSLQTGYDSGADQKELTLMFFILSTAKELGVIYEDTEFRLANGPPPLPKDTYVLKSDSIGEFITHPEPAIRVSALSLIVSTPSTTKPFSDAALAVLKKRLPLACSDSDPQYRGEVLALLRKLVIRLRGGLATLRKGTTSKLDPAILRFASAKSHIDFLEWYITFLRNELHPTASYQRHIFALRALIFLTETGLDSKIAKNKLSKSGNDQISWASNVCIFDPELFQVVANLLSNPFEDVRSSALTLLSLFPLQLLRETTGGIILPKGPMDQIFLALGRAEALASRTSRADHADAVARLYKLIFDLASVQSDSDDWHQTKAGVVGAIVEKLESHMSSSEAKSFDKAIRDKPFHGYVAALRCLVLTPYFYDLIDTTIGSSQWRIVHRRILELCEKIWMSVRGILCVDSPEGDYDDPFEVFTGSKDILSCSWRALRESSLLLHAMLSNTTYAPPSGLTAVDFATIGNLTFTQLAELRHRGAFSTVSQTFATCCQRCGSASNSDIEALLEDWYARIIETIHKQSTKLTRRSAGLPALVTGVAMYQPDGPFFSRMIADMQRIGFPKSITEIESTETKLPQVHALNALKDLFTNTKLGPYTEPHIPSCLKISADCLGSRVWAIRNCGLMLFRALMMRMCKSGKASKGFGGESGAEPGNRINFESCIAVGPLLGKLLEEEQKEIEINKQLKLKLGDLAICTERVFPALELIGEKIPAALSQGDAGLRDLVARHFASPAWGIRDQAARIFASLIRITDVLDVIEPFVSADLTEFSNNEVHGQALCIRYSLARVWHATNGHWRHDLKTVLDIVPKVSSNYSRSDQTPFVLATILEILIDAMIGLVKCGQESLVRTLYEDVISPADLSLILHGALSSSGSQFYRSSSLLFKAFLHATLIVHLISSLSDDEPDFLASATDDEVDTCRWVLELIHRDLGNHVKSRQTRFDLYISIIHQESPLELTYVAMSNLAKELTLLFSTEAVFPEDLQHLAAWAEIADIEESDGEIWDRDMCNASLHLQGCLLALRLAGARDIRQQYEHHIAMYAIKLRFAAEDETEFLTRMAAANSLKALVAGLRISNVVNQWKNDVFLEIYMVLYDLLNDDDEKIRNVAAGIVSWVLTDELESDGKGVRLLNPPAASEEFTHFLFEAFADSNQLFLQACNRMVGVNNVVMELPSVEQLLQSFCHTSTALFEEEKQNLFIDAVRDSNRWSRKLHYLYSTAMDEEVLYRLFRWAWDGLESLTAVVLECETDGVLGLSSKSDVFALGMKVLYTARAMLQLQSQCQFQCDDLLPKINDFLNAGKQMLVNPSWILIAESMVRMSN
ncbi:hypothetical protein KEM54_006317 [Ascosphaera aggregata]|nr:hypothetical protein KEM54_006317 [Ascosphaera aggregata]